MLNFADRDMKTKSKTSKDMFYRNQRRIVLFFFILLWPSGRGIFAAAQCCFMRQVSVLKHYAIF